MGSLGNLLFLGVGFVGAVLIVREVVALKKGQSAASGQPVAVPGGIVQWDPTSATANLVLTGSEVEKISDIDAWDQTGIISLQQMVGNGFVEMKAPGLIINSPPPTSFRTNKMGMGIFVPSGGEIYQSLPTVGSGYPRKMRQHNSTMILSQMAGIVFGITTKDQIFGYSDIDYGMKLNYDGSLQIVENGSLVMDPSFRPGDDLKIINTDGQVRYLKNGIVVYTSTMPLNVAWRAALSIFNNGQTVNGIKIQGNPAPLPLPLTQ